MKRAIYVLCLLLLLPVTALATDWKVMPEKSRINFIGTQNGAPVSGEFTQFNGQIRFDPNNLKDSKVKIIVDMNSISTSYQELTDTLKAAEWFDMKVFPEAVFESSSFTKTGDNQYEAKGTLKIRDHSEPLTLTFLFQQPTPDTAVVRGRTELQRTEFGVGQGEWAGTSEIGDTVKVNFRVNAVKIAPSPQH